MRFSRATFPLQRLRYIPARLDKTNILRIGQRQLRMSSQATDTVNGSTVKGGDVVNAWIGHKGPAGFDLRSG